MSIRIGIYGYGNLGRGVESAIRQNPDMELAAVFTRRDPSTLKLQTPGIPVVSSSDAASMKDKVDVLIICGGSSTDLPVQTPECIKTFNVVDSFDTHAKIPSHFQNVDTAGKNSGHLGAISVGWDPGLFSLARAYGRAVLPEGSEYTFWGKGVSQGHSDAVRRIEGVLDARQYTIPVPAALEAIRNGETPNLTTGEKHTREVFVVAKEGADLARIENEIKTMPNYFDEYTTTVHFISQDEMNKNHAGLPHGGSAFRIGKTGFDKQNTEVIEYKLTLDSNPEFTASVLIATARAVYRLHKEGKTGCITLLDIPPAYLSSMSGDELRKGLL